METANSYYIPDEQAYTQKILGTASTYCWRVEQEIKRSRFLISVGHSASKEESKRFIDAVRAEFFDATHNCWAYAAGAPGDTAQIGQSDDGEPHGTAGRPILNVLLHSNVGECVIVVTRYFGGIKLGTGGLVRAYQGCAAQALESLPRKEKISLAYADIIVDFAHLNKIYHVLPQYSAVIRSEVFQADAAYRIELPEKNLYALEKALTEATGGALLFSKIE